MVDVVKEERSWAVEVLRAASCERVELRWEMWVSRA